MVRSAAGHEMMAGFSNGNGACARPSTDVQTPGLKITRPTEEMRPTTPPLTAPLDVVPFQVSDIRMTGKFALAETAKVRPTI